MRGRGAPARIIAASLLVTSNNLAFVVIPAKAGIHLDFASSRQPWIPAYAGMTNLKDTFYRRQAGSNEM
ncbi:MAG: hypothetical protein ACREPH_11020 [Rhodanobacteraceae bacterium]